MEQRAFNHTTETRVRSYQIDAQRVVHNAWFFFMLEEGRAEYYRALGLLAERDAFATHAKFQVVNNSCDYRSPAFLDEVLEIGTRVVWVKNSSAGLEQYIIETSTRRLVAEATAVLVYLNVDTNLPERIPEAIRDKIAMYEGERVEFLKSEG